MSRQTPDAGDPRIQAALAELQQLILVNYPETVFDVFKGEDPCGVYLRATVDRDDLSDVIDTVLDKLYELQVEQELPVYVVTTQPPARVAAQLAARTRTR
jgi:hypothetical protein